MRQVFFKLEGSQSSLVIIIIFPLGRLGPLLLGPFLVVLSPSPMVSVLSPIISVLSPILSVLGSGSKRQVGPFRPSSSSISFLKAHSTMSLAAGFIFIVEFFLSPGFKSTGLVSLLELRFEALFCKFRPVVSKFRTFFLAFIAGPFKRGAFEAQSFSWLR